MLRIILEHAAGGSLDAAIHANLLDGHTHFDDATATRWLHQLASGLQYIHSHAILHRDLSSKNVLLSAPPQLDVRIADFGLSKARDGAEMAPRWRRD